MYVRQTMFVNLSFTLLLQYLGRTIRSCRTIHQNYRVTVFSRSSGDLYCIKTFMVHNAISRKLWSSVYIILLLERKISLLWDLNPRPPAYWAGALPTKLKRQLMMWATPIKNEDGASNHIHRFKSHQYPSHQLSVLTHACIFIRESGFHDMIQPVRS